MISTVIICDRCNDSIREGDGEDVYVEFIVTNVSGCCESETLSTWHLHPRCYQAWVQAGGEPDEDRTPDEVARDRVAPRGPSWERLNPLPVTEREDEEWSDRTDIPVTSQEDTSRS